MHLLLFSGGAFSQIFYCTWSKIFWDQTGLQGRNPFVSTRSTITHLQYTSPNIPKKTLPVYSLTANIQKTASGGKQGLDLCSQKPLAKKSCNSSVKHLIMLCLPTNIYWCSCRLKVQWTSIIKKLNENLSAQSLVKHKNRIQNLQEKI